MVANALGWRREQNLKLFFWPKRPAVSENHRTRTVIWQAAEEVGEGLPGLRFSNRMREAESGGITPEPCYGTVDILS